MKKVKKKRIELSVVIPAFNERESISFTLSELIKELKKKKINFEIILVDDGSTDDTASIGKKILKKKCDNYQIIIHDTNKGYTRAVKSGIEASRGDYVVVFDADYQYRASDVSRMFKIASTFNLDAVVSKTHRRNYNILRKLLSKLYLIFSSFLFFKRINFSITSLKLVKRKILLDLFYLDWVYDLELSLRLVNGNYRIGILPIPTLKRIAGKSKVNLVIITKTLLNSFKLLRLIKGKGRKRRRILPKVYLTFDIEELEALRRDTAISSRGAEKLLKVLKRNSIKSTVFFTAFFAIKNPTLIKKFLKEGHEIGSHFFYDTDINQLTHVQIKKLIRKSTKVLRNFGEIKGFRMPKLRFRFCLLSELIKNGYLYDSSVTSSLNSVIKRPTIFLVDGGERFIVEVPISSFPLFKVGIKWIMKNLDGILAKLVLKNILQGNYTLLYFHSWELENLNNTNLPLYMRFNSGNFTIKFLEGFIGYLRKFRIKFSTISEMIFGKDRPVVFDIKFLDN